MADPAAPLAVHVLAGRLSIARLPADAGLPDWAGGPWCSVTRTHEELSVVCESDRVPEEVKNNGPWRALMVAGPLEFGLTGILNRLAGPLADAGISIFAVSTFDTDYVLVREERLQASVACLRGAGIVVHPGD